MKTKAAVLYEIGKGIRMKKERLLKYENEEGNDLFI